MSACSVFVYDGDTPLDLTKAVIGLEWGDMKGELAARDLFMAKVTSSRALDDGCGITVPEDDYLVIKSAGKLSEGMNVLAAWVDGCAVVIGVV